MALNLFMEKIHILFNLKAIELVLIQMKTFVSVND